MFSNNLASYLKEAISFIVGVSNPLNTGKYLGLPSIVGRSKRQIFRHLKERLWHQLQKWRQRPISKAGRATLIRAAAQAIHVYYMSVFMLPSSTTAELEWMLNSFWWGSKRDGHRSINWIAWDRLCVPKKFGGLGYRNFTAFNIAMLGKQGWRLLANPASLVSRVFKAKYYPRGSFMEARLGHSPSFIWRSIWQSQIVLKEGCRWKIGTGSAINVWDDPWLRDDSNFWVETTADDATRHLQVSDLILSDTHSWDVEKVNEMFSIRDRNAILSIHLSLMFTEDKLIWHWSPNGIYSVKTGYRVLTERVEPNSSFFIEGDWSRIWKASVPHKVRQFIWRAARDVFPTRVNLQTKGIQVPCTCLLCCRNPENSWHIFVDCPTTIEVWREAGLWDVVDRHTSAMTSYSKMLFTVLRDNPSVIGDKFIMITRRRYVTARSLVPL